MASRQPRSPSSIPSTQLLSSSSIPFVQDSFYHLPPYLLHATPCLLPPSLLHGTAPVSFLHPFCMGQPLSPSLISSACDTLSPSSIPSAWGSPCLLSPSLLQICYLVLFHLLFHKVSEVFLSVLASNRQDKVEKTDCCPYMKSLRESIRLVQLRSRDDGREAEAGPSGLLALPT